MLAGNRRRETRPCHWRFRNIQSRAFLFHASVAHSTGQLRLTPSDRPPLGLLHQLHPNHNRGATAAFIPAALQHFPANNCEDDRTAGRLTRSVSSASCTIERGGMLNRNNPTATVVTKTQKKHMNTSLVGLMSLARRQARSVILFVTLLSVVGVAWTSAAKGGRAGSSGVVYVISSGAVL